MSVVHGVLLTSSGDYLISGLKLGSCLKSFHQIHTCDYCQLLILLGLVLGAK